VSLTALGFEAHFEAYFEAYFEVIGCFTTATSHLLFYTA
jgi:hypothetical protein